MKYNNKCTITRPVVASQNSLGENILTTSTTIVTNKSCYLQKSSGYQIQQRESGVSSLEHYTMYISASVDIHNNDNVSINSVDYTVILVVPIGKRFLSVSLVSKINM